jgi:hypothetical protein
MQGEGERIHSGPDQDCADLGQSRVPSPVATMIFANACIHI